MNKSQKILIAIIVILAVGAGVAFMTRSKKEVAPIDLGTGASPNESAEPLNQGDVSPISGLQCENWKRRPIAVMQPADLQARPTAGFSKADLIFEMPAYTASVTRLMGVYLCELPDEMGAIRSSRHDYIPLAKGLDAVFVHWGGSHFALDLLKKGVIDNMDCMTYSGKYCFRWDWQNDPKMRMEDSGYVTKDSMMSMMEDLGFRKENNFSGYPHQAEAPDDQRGNGGHLRVAFAGPYAVEYDYDKESNTFLRTWGKVEDTDKNTGERLAPKNVVVMFAKSDQITNTYDYKGKGLQDPWEEVEEIKNTGVESISGRYNNVQVGDPWYDETDSGDAYYYMNGQEYRGTWKKDRSKIDSKLMFYDNAGNEVKFVPGQIWVEILEPGQTLKWEPVN